MKAKEIFIVVIAAIAITFALMGIAYGINTIFADSLTEIQMQQMPQTVVFLFVTFAPIVSIVWWEIKESRKK
jgi:DMSO/TMAO reductase YedYZ heme-binding membrane subunit